MEDKTFELLTKMYHEFSGKFDKINTRLTKIETAIENEIKLDIKAALDGYQMVYEKLKEQQKSIEEINSKLEKQDVEITVIKGGRKEVL